jgi:hypothetical protein
VGGEASDPLAIGDTCCTTLVALRPAGRLLARVGVRRRVVAFTDQRRYTPLHTWCRAFYAGVLTTTGEWERAERELAHGDRKARAIALARLAALREAHGRFEEADELLAGCHGHPEALEPLVALASSATTWRSPRPSSNAGSPLRARIPARAPSCFGSRRRCCSPGARSNALGGLAADSPGLPSGSSAPTLRPRRTWPAGGGLAPREPEAAIARLDAAARAFAQLDMPLDEARARLESARLLAARGSPPARAEGRPACDALERLGARSAHAARARGAGPAVRRPHERGDRRAPRH